MTVAETIALLVMGLLIVGLLITIMRQGVPGILRRDVRSPAMGPKDTHPEGTRMPASSKNWSEDSEPGREETE